MSEVTREYLEQVAARLSRETNEVALRLSKDRREDLHEALDRQNDQIEKLFDAKLVTLHSSVIAAGILLSEHVKDDDRHFGEVNTAIGTIKTALAINTAKIAGVIALIAAVASTVGAFVAKHFMSIAVLK